MIAQVKPEYKVINHRVESFQNAKNIHKKGPNMVITCMLCVFFLIFNMVLPFTGEWYGDMITIPKDLGIFSFAVIVNAALAIYVMFMYGRHFVVNAYVNYK